MGFKNSRKKLKLSLLADNLEDLKIKLELALKGDQDKDIFYKKDFKGKLCFLFSGQGSQSLYMGKDLFQCFPQLFDGFDFGDLR